MTVQGGLSFFRFLFLRWCVWVFSKMAERTATQLRESCAREIQALQKECKHEWNKWKEEWTFDCIVASLDCQIRTCKLCELDERKAQCYKCHVEIFSPNMIALSFRKYSCRKCYTARLAQKKKKRAF